MLTAMNDTVTCAAGVTAALPREQALALFTAEGERAWAGEEWDPAYPAAGRSEGPGAVFVTTHGHETTWVMADQDAPGVRSAGVPPAVAAGTVAVAVVEAA